MTRLIGIDLDRIVLLDEFGRLPAIDGSNLTNVIGTGGSSPPYPISDIIGLQTALDSKLAADTYTANDILTKLLSVDGTASGLDADLLDGRNSATGATANTIPVRDGSGKLPGDILGNAATASALQTSRTITLEGDLAGWTTFDGSANVTLTANLSNTGVSSGTYTKVTVDSRGRVSAGAAAAIADISGLQAALDAKVGTSAYTAADVLTKLLTVDGTASGLDADLLDGYNTSTTANANTIPVRNASGQLPGDILGNAATASKLIAARSITLSGAVSGTASFDGSANVTITTTGTLAFTNLTDVPTSYTSQVGKALRVNPSANGLEFYSPSFMGLADVPGSYTGQAGKAVRVNAGANGLEFFTLPSPGATAFTGLSDVPNSFSTHGLKRVRVNTGATALEFITDSFLNLQDTPASYTGAALQAVRVNAAGNALEFYTPSAGGASAFTSLTDVPTSYTGQGGKGVRVKSSADGLEFYTISTGATAFTGLSDVPTSYTSQNNKVVRVNGTGTALEFVTPNFTHLGDVPTSYTGQAGKVLRVNSGATALEFFTLPSAGATAFTGLSDVPTSYTGQGGKGVRVNSGATGLEFYTITTGATAFTGLSDAPTSYTGHGLKGVRVKSTADGLEFYTITTGATAFTGLTDVPSTYSGHGTKRVRVNTGGTGLEFINDSFLNLQDTPSSYVGAANQAIRVNSGATGLEFFAPLTDAPSDGTTYGRKNGAWVATTGGGGAMPTLYQRRYFEFSATLPGMNITTSTPIGTGYVRMSGTGASLSWNNGYNLSALTFAAAEEEMHAHLLSPGTTTTGYCTVSCGGYWNRRSTTQWEFRAKCALEAIPDTTDDFAIGIGLCSGENVTGFNNTAQMFYLTRTTVNGLSQVEFKAWAGYGGSGGQSEMKATGVPLVANKVYDFRIIYASGTTTYYIDGVQVATSTLVNNSVSNSYGLKPIAGISKIAGTTAKILYVTNLLYIPYNTTWV